MTDDEPGLDLSVPFPIRKVKKATEHIFSRDRFNKYLRRGRTFASRSTKTKLKSKSKSRKSRRYEDSDNESNSESGSESDTESSDESDDKPIATWRSSRHTGRPTTKSKGCVDVDEDWEKDERGATTEETPSKEVRDEIAELTRQMEKLEISEPRYHTLYTQLNVLPVPKEVLELYPPPTVASLRSYLTQGIAQGKVTFAERVRDLPPHQMGALFNQRIRE